MIYFPKCFIATVISCVIFIANSSSAQSGYDLTNWKEVEGIRCFAEPVVPYSEPTTSDTQAVGFLMLDYSTDYSSRKLDAIKDWAMDNPKSPWTISLLMNAGRTYFQAGYFSKALECWKKGWEFGSNSGVYEAKLPTDTCFGELALVYGRIGRMAELDALYAINSSRTLQGPGAVLATYARDGLGVMKSDPGSAFKCGPFALISIRKSMNLPDAIHKTLMDAQSTTAGFSLAEVKALANNIGMDYEVVKINSVAKYPVPSVVHWKLGHYGALTEYKNGKYHLEDPTFARDFWITKDAIESETSGYFIVPASALSSDYETVSTEVASNIRGKGYTYFCNPRGTTSCDSTAGGSGGCSSCPRCNFLAPWSTYMPAYTMHPALANLSIFDTPVGYNPPYGPPVNFNIAYNSREYDQPTTFNYSNFGHNWSFTWMSFVTLDTSSETTKPVVFMPGGGSIEYRNYNATSACYENSELGSAVLKYINANSYELIEPDGSKKIYNLVETSTGNFKRIMMTSIVDADGFALTLGFDGSFRLTSVTDAQGGVTTICYEDSCGTPIDKKIRKITDRYGRSAVFGYDGSGRLNSITDTINLTTTFDYDSGNFITAMNTPYGSTTFTGSEETDGYTVHGRWLEAKDPVGDTERVEYKRHTPELPYSFDIDDLPEVSVRNSYMDYRNAFYWSKSAMKTGTCSVENAKQIHFVHDPNHSPLVTGRLVEWTKEPLEDRVFYFYDGQLDAAEYGDNNSPSRIARLLDDGRTQKIDLIYNDRGNVETYVDQEGRTTKVQYNSLGNKLTSMKQVTDLGDVNILNVDYNGSGLPETIIDEAGAQTTVLYNEFKQPISITNDNNETFTIDYTTTGLLKRDISIDINAYVEYSYDEYDRISSATLFPDNYTIKYLYDVGNRLKKTVYPDGTYEELIYDKLDIIASRDRAGRWTQMRYSLLGQLESITNPAGDTTQYSWCACGSISRLVDAEGKITSFIRDVKGRLLKQIDPDLKETSYYYQPRNGLVAAKTDPKGQITHFSYNKDNSIFKSWVTNVGIDTASVSGVEYAYDKYFPRLKEWNDSLGTTTLTYIPYDSTDSQLGDGKVESVISPGNVNVLTNTYNNLGWKVGSSFDGNSYFHSLKYDSSGRITSSTNNMGTSTYDYIAHTKRLFKIQNPLQATNFQYEDQNKDFSLKLIGIPSPFGDDGRFFKYERDVLGRITKWSKGIYGEAESPNEYTAEYDDSHRLTGLTVSSLWDGLKARWDWRISKSENRFNMQYERIAENESVNLTRSKYTVNEADQLVSVDSGGPLHVSGTANEQSKVYTGLSDAPVLTKGDGSFSAWVSTNLLNSATFSIKDFLNNNGNKTVSVPSAVAVPSYQFSYDGNGNRTRMVTTYEDGLTTSEITYEWDCLNQLVAINAGEHRSEFSYDGMGRRIRIKELDNGSVESDKFFIWNGLTIVASGNSNLPGISNATKKYYEEGFALGNHFYFYTKDHLGSVVRVLDNYENNVDVSYTPYGDPSLSGDYADEVDFLYTGYFYHRPSGLYLATYRVYDPKFGSWLSEDPTKSDGPNPYAYVLNNPINYYDELGLAISPKCAQLANQIGSKWKSYLDDLGRYDPVEDGKGGHSCFWSKGKKTTPGGHFTELIQRKNGILNDLADLVKECIKNKPPDDRPRYPREIDEGVRRPIPPVIYPPMPFYGHIPGSNGLWNGIAGGALVCAAAAGTVATAGTLPAWAPAWAPALLW